MLCYCMCCSSRIYVKWFNIAYQPITSTRNHFVYLMRAWLQEDTHDISWIMDTTSKARKINKEKIGFSLIAFHKHIPPKPDQIQMDCRLKAANNDHSLVQTFFTYFNYSSKARYYTPTFRWTTKIDVVWPMHACMTKWFSRSYVSSRTPLCADKVNVTLT